MSVKVVIIRAAFRKESIAILDAWHGQRVVQAQRLDHHLERNDSMRMIGG